MPLPFLSFHSPASLSSPALPKVSFRRRRKLLFLYDRALAFAQRLGRLFGRNGTQNLVVVPFCLGFARLLNLDQIHVVYHAAVLAHSPFSEEIIDREFPHLVCHSLTV